jgi:thioredoxin reductase (NADPH)
MSQRFDVVVIGCGVAGLSAARQALRNGMSTATVECLLPGGLVLNVNHLVGEIQGAGMDLATDLMTEITSLGAENISATVDAVRPDGGDLVVSTDAGEHRAGAVIVASGARFKRLGIPGETELEGQGVSHCADCDGPLFQNQEVVVVGGGDSALQEALVLSGYARRVHLVHRGTEFRARRDFVEAVRKQPKIQLHLRTVAEAAVGANGVQAVRVRALDGSQSRDIACAGFFPFIGLEPVCEFIPHAAKRDAQGCLVTDDAMRTTLPGIYAAGAVRSGYGGLVSQAMAEGIAAANSAKAQK